MTEEMFRAVLETAQAKTDKEGWATMPEGRSLTLYAAHNGVPLTVAKIDSLRVSQEIIRTRSVKGQTYVLALSDVFAAALDGGSDTPGGRKAGFLGGAGS